MNSEAQSVYRERIYEIQDEIEEKMEDISLAFRHIDKQLFGNYSDASLGSDFWGRKYKPDDLVSWLHFGREQVGDVLKFYRTLTDIIDEIEDEVNKDEVNNADR